MTDGDLDSLAFETHMATTAVKQLINHVNDGAGTLVVRTEYSLRRKSVVPFGRKLTSARSHCSSSNGADFALPKKSLTKRAITRKRFARLET
jgi:hypothetical protein